LALFEWLAVNPAVRHEINHGASAEKLEAAALQSGMKLLRERGRDAVAQGITTDAEVLRVLGSQEME